MGPGGGGRAGQARLSSNQCAHCRVWRATCCQPCCPSRPRRRAPSPSRSPPPGRPTSRTACRAAAQTRPAAQVCACMWGGGDRVLGGKWMGPCGNVTHSAASSGAALAAGTDPSTEDGKPTRATPRPPSPAAAARGARRARGQGCPAASVPPPCPAPPPAAAAAPEPLGCSCWVMEGWWEGDGGVGEVGGWGKEGGRQGGEAAWCTRELSCGRALPCPHHLLPAKRPLLPPPTRCTHAQAYRLAPGGGPSLGADMVRAPLPPRPPSGRAARSRCRRAAVQQGQHLKPLLLLERGVVVLQGRCWRRTITRDCRIRGQRVAPRAPPREPAARIHVQQPCPRRAARRSTAEEAGRAQKPMGHTSLWPTSLLRVGRHAASPCLALLPSPAPTQLRTHDELTWAARITHASLAVDQRGWAGGGGGRGSNK